MAVVASCSDDDLQLLILPPSAPSAAAQRELASFDSPLRSLHDVRRLLACRHAAPTALVAGEFSGALRFELLRSHGELALSVDVRKALNGGMHYVGDVSDLLNIKRWRRAFLFLPCTHQVRCDTLTLRQKMRHGRAFWGLAFLLRCRCTDADCVVLEQPNTIAPDFLPLPRPARLRPSHFGDPSRKPINLFLRGTDEPHLPCLHALSSTAGLAVLADFPTPTAETATAVPGLDTSASAPPSPGNSPRATPSPPLPTSGPSSSPSLYNSISPACLSLMNTRPPPASRPARQPAHTSSSAAPATNA
eukprot:3090084-Pleurochrysis_carterae.AAC.1